MTYENKFEVLNYRVHIANSVYRILQRFIQDEKHKPESGGILMGQVKERDIYVQKLTVPGGADKNSRYSFTRDKDAAQIILDHEAINSLNTVTYLGEWHTHPELSPSPSLQDYSMIKEQFAKGKLNLPFVLLLIQGIDKVFLSMYIKNQFHVASRRNTQNTIYES